MTPRPRSQWLAGNRQPFEYSPVPLPVVFFAHAVGGSVTDSADDDPHYYSHIFEELNEQGFVVIATTVSGGWEFKQEALQCALEWAYTQWSERDHLGCDVVFMGHSAGGGAAQAMVSWSQAPEVQEYFPVNVRAAVGIAPAVTAGPTLADAAVPYLLLQDPADSDSSTHAGIVYDGIVPEDPPPPPPEDPPVFPPTDFEFDAVAAPHGPPTVEIDMPASVTCSSTVALEAITADPQGDHLPTRWEVDGVLLSASVDEIEVNTSHTIRATVRDLRGTATTDEHVIACTP